MGWWALTTIGACLRNPSDHWRGNVESAERVLINVKNVSMARL